MVSNSNKNIKKKVFKGKKKAHVNLKDICNYCKEPSHWKKDCPKKKGKPSAVVDKEGSTSENELVLSVVDHHQYFENQWILDYGCSFHMCPSKSWFDTYEENLGEMSSWEMMSYARQLELAQ